MYYVGIDGGGTKSRLMAASEAGKLMGPLVGGPTNLNSNRRQDVARNLGQLLDQFCAQAGVGMDKVGSVCVGSAGVDTSLRAREYTRLLREDLRLDCPVQVVNDVEIVLESEVGDQPGIVLIAGTGSVAFGRSDSGETVRVGGWGQLVGDEGSGYWIANQAIRQCLRSYDGRERATMLINLVKRELGLSDIRDVLDFVYSPTTNKADVAALAPLVDIAAGRRDALANEILARAAEDLARMAQAVASNLRMEEVRAIVLSGGLACGSVPLRKLLLPKLAPLSDNVRNTSRESCVGAVAIARRIALGS